MSTETQTFDTLQQLKDALPGLPDDAVLRDSEGDTVYRRSIHLLEGVYAPYTVTYEVATPSPLDPSKVKAGDTVTLEKGETTVRGPVTGISYAGGGEWDFRVGEEPYRRAGRIGLWAVTHHQPAPEPEPEWKPGTVARLSLLDDDLAPRVYRTGIGTWHAIDDTRSWSDADVEYVHEMVVIDPAEVDVEALAKTWTETLAGGSNLTISPLGALWYEALRAVLAKLGIEVAR